MEDRSLPSSHVVLLWNDVLPRSLSSQPPRVPMARNRALVNVAMCDAVNAIDRSYAPYVADVQAYSGASQKPAAARVIVGEYVTDDYLVSRGQGRSCSGSGPADPRALLFASARAAAPSCTVADMLRFLDDVACAAMEADDELP